MKKLFEYTEDFNHYDPKEPYNEVVYRILIIHDNSKESIIKKFSFCFLDSQNNSSDSCLINSWEIRRVYSQDYYGRATVYISIVDPEGTTVPGLQSGGFTLDITENYNISKIEEAMTEVLKKVRKISCFRNLRSRLDYLNIMSLEKYEVPYHHL